MVVVVQDGYMWQRPVVKRVFRQGGQLHIKAEFVKVRRILQHAGGVGSYVAIVVPKSSEQVVLAQQAPKIRR